MSIRWGGKPTRREVVRRSLPRVVGLSLDSAEAGPVSSGNRPPRKGAALADRANITRRPAFGRTFSVHHRAGSFHSFRTGRATGQPSKVLVLLRLVTGGRPSDGQLRHGQ